MITSNCLVTDELWGSEALAKESTYKYVVNLGIEKMLIDKESYLSDELKIHW
jgi:hypothetical protein